jgi:hypothetical protein
MYPKSHERGGIMSNVWSDEERMNAVDGIEEKDEIGFWKHNLPLFIFWAILGVIVLVALWMGMFV